MVDFGLETQTSLMRQKKGSGVDVEAFWGDNK
jgi:hypothetical protein